MPSDLKYNSEFFVNLESYLLKEEGDTRDNLKTNEEIDFFNSSLDFSNSKNDSLWKNSALFSFEDSHYDLEAHKKIRKDSSNTIHFQALWNKVSLNFL